MLQALGILIASLVAFASPRGDCGACSFVDGDALLCEFHDASDAAATSAARRLLSRSGDDSIESRVRAAQDLAEATGAHANAPSREVAELLADAVGHPQLAVRVAVLRALHGQHPEVAARGFLAGAHEYVEEYEAFEQRALAPLPKLPAQASKAKLLKGLDRIQAELEQRTAEMQDLATHGEAYYAAVTAGLESLPPGEDRDEAFGALIEVQSYAEGVRIVELLLESGLASSLRQAVRPFECRNERIEELEKQLEAKLRERPGKRPKTFKDRKAWEQQERARLAEEAAKIEQSLSHPVAHLTEVQALLRVYAQANGLPEVPGDVTSDRSWTAWAKRAAARQPAGQDAR